MFVDGCFWHGCGEHGCGEHGRRVHRTNGWHRPEKIEQNRARERDTDARLSAAGWLPVRTWKHEEPHRSATKIMEAVAERARPFVAD